MTLAKVYYVNLIQLILQLVLIFIIASPGARSFNSHELFTRVYIMIQGVMCFGVLFYNILFVVKVYNRSLQKGTFIKVPRFLLVVLLNGFFLVYYLAGSMVLIMENFI